MDPQLVAQFILTILQLGGTVFAIQIALLFIYLQDVALANHVLGGKIANAFPFYFSLVASVFSFCFLFYTSISAFLDVETDAAQYGRGTVIGSSAIFFMYLLFLLMNLAVIISSKRESLRKER